MIFKCFEKRTSDIGYEERDKIQLEGECICISVMSCKIVLHVSKTGSKNALNIAKKLLLNSVIRESKFEKNFDIFREVFAYLRNKSRIQKTSCEKMTIRGKARILQILRIIAPKKFHFSTTSGKKSVKFEIFG